jgi:hypothetical protein
MAGQAEWAMPRRTRHAPLSISKFRHGPRPICIATISGILMRRPIVAAFHHVGDIWLLVSASCGIEPTAAGDNGRGQSEEGWGDGERARKDGPQRNDEIVACSMRRFRIARGLSQTELGNAVGVTFLQIQKYEKARTRLRRGGCGKCARYSGSRRQRCLAASQSLMVGRSRRCRGGPIGLWSP